MHFHQKLWIPPTCSASMQMKTFIVTVHRDRTVALTGTAKLPVHEHMASVYVEVTRHVDLDRSDALLFDKFPSQQCNAHSRTGWWSTRLRIRNALSLLDGVLEVPTLI